MMNPAMMNPAMMMGGGGGYGMNPSVSVAAAAHAHAMAMQYAAQQQMMAGGAVSAPITPGTGTAVAGVAVAAPRIISEADGESADSIRNAVQM